MTTKSKTAKGSKPAQKTKSPVKQPVPRFSIAGSARGTAKERIASLRADPLAVVESDKNLQAVLKVLSNKDEPVKIRFAALQTLQAASFSVDVFQSCRRDYIATLRKIADDPDPELRQRVLGILAREKDGFAQKKLLEGLKNPEKALVPPEKALQLLSYDVHAEAYAAAREIVNKPPNPLARREALRMLAADANSAPLFEKILRNKSELAEVRQIAASAMQSLRPDRMQALAREMVIDKSEYPEIQETSLTALSQFGDEESMRKDKPLLKGLDHMKEEKSTSARGKQDVRRFINRLK